VVVVVLLLPVVLLLLDTGRDFTTKLIPNVEVLLQRRAGSRYNRRICRTLLVAF